MTVVASELLRVAPSDLGTRQLAVGIAVADLSTMTSEVWQDQLALAGLLEQQSSRRVNAGRVRVLACGPELAAEDQVDAPAIDCDLAGLDVKCVVKLAAPAGTASFRRIAIWPVLRLDLLLLPGTVHLKMTWRKRFPPGDAVTANSAFIDEVTELALHVQ